MADSLLQRLVMREAIHHNVDDDNSKSEQCEVVLVFKSLVDRQEHITAAPQMICQDVIGQPSPSQFQDGGNGMVGM